MLTAKSRDGTLITLPEILTANMLALIKASAPYYCPCCATELVIKAGAMKIPHFAHKSNTSCHASSEPESPYHLLAKRQLFSWLKDHGYQAELEAYLPVIKKRADILVKSEEQTYAFEFQCSTISEAVFIERTESYKSLDITPIWILAEKNIKRVDAQEFRLSAFQWLFVTGVSAYPFLWTYCPERNQLFALKGITPFSPATVFAEMTAAPLQLLSPKHLIPRIHEQFPFITLWRYKRKSWCLHRVKAANLHNPFFLALYRHRLTAATLPIEVGIPVKGMTLIKTAAIEWQAWLYLDVLHKRELGQFVQLRTFLQSFQKRVAKGVITLRTLPLVKRDAFHPVYEYIAFLVQAGYLIETTAGCYKLTKEITIPKTMIEQEELEKMFYHEYKWMLEKNNIIYNEKA